MLQTELYPTRLPQQLEHPACKSSELLWLWFLLCVDRDGLTNIAPVLLTFFEYASKENFQEYGVTKDISEKKVGAKTVLCLTGKYAGAICLHVPSNNGWESWSMNPTGIIADAVPLRMIRRAFIGNKYILKDLEEEFGYTFSGDAKLGDTYLVKLLELLKKLEWQHDAEQITTNAV